MHEGEDVDRGAGPDRTARGDAHKERPDMVTVHPHDTGTPAWPHVPLLRTLADDWGWILVRGIAAVAFGLAAFVWPGLSLFMLMLLWAAYAIVDGGFALAAALLGRDHDAASRLWLGLSGSVSLVAGLLAIAWPGMTAAVLVLVIASWAIASGVLEIWAAIYLRREIDGEWLLGLTGLLSIAFGVILFVQPAAGALALAWLIGAFAVLIGVSLMALAFRVRQFKQPT
jgi:uncharacterized membrane protein HdeD (DUF308 family)